MSLKVASEVEVNGKLYQFVCDADSSLGCVHDALCKIKSQVVEQILAQQAKDMRELSSSETD